MREMVLGIAKAYSKLGQRMGYRLGVLRASKKR
jgi:hypothetical protein